jgi:hypothetical protein
LAKTLNASGVEAAFDFDFDEWEEVKVRVNDQLPEDGDIDIGQALCVSLELYGYAIDSPTRTGSRVKICIG